MNQPTIGSLLISDPFLKDPNFIRSVVFLCVHNNEGTIGFVLNRRFENNLSELLNDMEAYPIPVYYGGPVQTDTLHFVHSLPEMIPDSQAIGNGIFWGGNFETVLASIRNKTLDLERIRFFVGYSGWSGGQLDKEMKGKSWLSTTGSAKLIFHSKPEQAWKDAVKLLGKKYAEIINYPIDPSLN